MHQTVMVRAAAGVLLCVFAGAPQAKDEPVKASPAGEPARAQAMSGDAARAQKAHEDRLMILAQERAAILAKKEQRVDASAEETARIEGELEAIEREIALVRKQPVYVQKLSGPKGGTPKASPQQVAASAATVEPRPNEQAQKPRVNYEGWDVFKNFGQKD